MGRGGVKVGPGSQERNRGCAVSLEGRAFQRRHRSVPGCSKNPKAGAAPELPPPPRAPVPLLTRLDPHPLLQPHVAALDWRGRAPARGLAAPLDPVHGPPGAVYERRRRRVAARVREAERARRPRRELDARRAGAEARRRRGRVEARADELRGVRQAVVQEFAEAAWGRFRGRAGVLRRGLGWAEGRGAGAGGRVGGGRRCEGALTRRVGGYRHRGRPRRVPPTHPSRCLRTAWCGPRRTGRRRGRRTGRRGVPRCPTGQRPGAMRKGGERGEPRGRQRMRRRRWRLQPRLPMRQAACVRACATRPACPRPPCARVAARAGTGAGRRRGGPPKRTRAPRPTSSSSSATSGAARAPACGAAGAGGGRVMRARVRGGGAGGRRGTPGAVQPSRCERDRDGRSPRAPWGRVGPRRGADWPTTL
jgi:hypothetical protein